MDRKCGKPGKLWYARSVSNHRLVEGKTSLKRVDEIGPIQFDSFIGDFGRDRFVHADREHDRCSC